MPYNMSFSPSFSPSAPCQDFGMNADTPIDPRSAAIFATLAAALWVKGLIVSYVQVRARVRGRAFERPEDAAMMRRMPAPEPALALRAGDAWRNETENGPFFLALAAAAVLVGAPHLVLGATSIAFVFARAIHAWAQIAALQPLRTLAWIAGVLASLTLAGATLAAARSSFT